MTSSPGLASTATPLTVIATVAGATVSDTRTLLVPRLGCLRHGAGRARARGRGVLASGRADERRALHRDVELDGPPDVGLELVLEPHDRAGDGRGGRLAERADGGHARR